MISATKAHEYEQRITKDHTLGLNNCDNVMGNDAFLLNRMKVSTEIRRSQNPLDAVQNIRGYDAQGNKILINQEAVQSGFLSDQGVNYEMVGSTKKSVNRMFDRQFENQAVFLNQSYNPHINQMRPTDPRDENLREKDELKNNYPGQTQVFASSTSYTPFQQGPSQSQQGSNGPYTQGALGLSQNAQPNLVHNQNIPPQTCPYCKSMKHVPFLPDGGSVLICQVCQKTFNNIYYNANNPLVQGPQSPWFSDKFKASDQQNAPTVMQVGQVGGGQNHGPPGLLSEFGQFSPRRRQEPGQTSQASQASHPSHPSHASQIGWTPVSKATGEMRKDQRMQVQNPHQNSQMLDTAQGQALMAQQTMMQEKFRPFPSRAAQGMRGEGNYSQEEKPQSPMQNNYADHANSQLRSYRAKFDFDHHSLRGQS